VAQFLRQSGGAEVTVYNLARVQSPDASPVTRKIVQHISWAPVIVTIQWPSQAADVPTIHR
jgi:hypothetical protein